MTKSSGGMDCTFQSFLMAALIGLLAAIALRFFGGFDWTPAIFIGLLLLVLLGLFFNWLFCRDLPALGEVEAPNAPSPSKATAGVAAGAAAAVGATAAAGSGAGGTASADDGAPTGASAADANAGTVTSAAASAGADASVTSAKPAAGTAKAASTKADAPKAKKAPAKKAAAPKPKAKATKASGDAAGGDKAKVDYDGDGKIEGTDEGTRPAALDGARGGKADDLKQIKGIGPKLEKLCNRLGFYHFDQIAGWSADEVAWVDANLEGFRGRVTRDEWVKQAGILAKGGETEFSKRVEDGDVY